MKNVYYRKKFKRKVFLLVSNRKVKGGREGDGSGGGVEHMVTSNLSKNYLFFFI